jgi:arginyl-tRNA synthetase
MEQKIINELSRIMTDINIDDITLSVPKDVANGNYSSNIAMKSAKALGMNPREVAEKIKSEFNVEGVSKVEIAGPGFINFYVDDNILYKQIDDCVNLEQVGKGKTILIDYSSPNIAKKMHIAHLRSTAIGDSLKRIYNRLGYNAFGINHIGD